MSRPLCLWGVLSATPPLCPLNRNPTASPVAPFPPPRALRRPLQGTALAQTWQYLAYVRANMHKHPSTNAIFLQEGASVAGVGIAFFALQLTHWTGLLIFDSLGR